MAYSEARRPKVAVIGAGVLGLALSGIAKTIFTVPLLSLAIGELARCGCNVCVHDTSEANLQRVHNRLEEQRAQLIEEDLLVADESFSVRL